MPNWCQNRLKIQGDPERLKAWREAQRGVPAKYTEEGALPAEVVDFTFNAQVPVPAETLNLGYSSLNDLTLMASAMLGKELPEGTVLDGHNWQIRHWGTKWDAPAGEMDFEENSDGLSVVFDTAWSPPIAWMVKMADLWPDLAFTLEYIELGMSFAGSVTAEGGKYTQEHHQVTKADLEEWGYDPDEDEDEEEAVVEA